MRTTGEESRSKILTTAKTLFIQHGYANTSIRTIAEAAGGRTVANIYTYFNSKEAIFATLLKEDNSLAELAAHLEELYSPNTPLLVGHILRIFLDYIQTHREFVELLIIDMREFDRKYLTAMQDDIRPVLTRLTNQLETMPDASAFNSMVVRRILTSLAIGFVFTEKLDPNALFSQIAEAVWIEHFINVCTGGIDYLASAKAQIIN